MSLPPFYCPTIVSGHRLGWPAVVVAGECGGTVLAVQGDDGKVRRSGQPEQDQRERRGCGLDVEDPAADGRRAIDAGHDHAEQKERLDLEVEGRIGEGAAPRKAPPRGSRYTDPDWRPAPPIPSPSRSSCGKSSG